MDAPVLPNNNHPQKFFQLDVRMPPVTHKMVQGVLEQRAEMKSRWSPSQEDSVVFVERYLEKHRTPGSLQSHIKTNPLYSMTDAMDVKTCKPSWTIKEYTTQTGHGRLTDFLQDEEKTAKDLDFWLEDLYTPGFDALLKKKQAEDRRKRLHKIICVIGLSISVVLIVIIVPVVVLERKV
ncbi:major intrinsically disordered NOTCH2-binding receptor 1-like isoform X2 [Dunckerocampus dactyliophorus]|uniref:major intrinsically disordered NOTCH2-binding receptor 1-like isoform X2 n=1 Tax=Dunckerocampus dactyliophorus TaxID=161453 RepID=UPI00240760D8|nr:major intrinsically disordered NOTCH2-binding receptor 1-like isoform X2 [Dunckerocampus dactyliophorus]